MSWYLLSLAACVLLLILFLVRFLRARHPCRGILAIGTGSPYHMRENRRQGHGWKQFPLRPYHANRIVLKESDLPEGVHFTRVVISCPTDAMCVSGTVRVKAIRPHGEPWEATLAPKALLTTEREEWFYKDPFLREEPQVSKRIFVDLSGVEMFGWVALIALLGGLSFYLWWVGG